jgi:predicted nucleotidyltransferase component of viral defense system
MKHEYAQRVKLLLEILPYFSVNKQIAIKGGTAINMFYRDFPRVSVDIDLVYLPINSRDETLIDIDNFLRKVTEILQMKRPGIGIFPKKSVHNRLSGLTIEENGLIVKIEPNTILRGSVYPVEMREVQQSVLDETGYEGFINIQVLSLEDLYGGKICAALDRQHPRDLFDIMILFEREGLTPAILKAFVVYLAGHDRPMNELLSPKRLDMREIFHKEFIGMTDRSVTWEELADVREQLVQQIHTKLSLPERKFLVSIKRGEPEWDQLGISGIEVLPSLQWKLMNIKKMSKEKHDVMLTRLLQVLKM